MSEETKPAEPKPAEAPAEPTPEQLKDYALRWMETATPEDILRVNRVGGILGMREQTARERIRKEIEEENSTRAKLEAEADLEKLANEDPGEFARRFLTTKEQDKIKEEQRTLRQGVRKEFAEKIGSAYRGLAEWQEITPEEFGKLKTAVESVSDEEALTAFNLAAVEIISDRKANKRVNDFKTKELAKEREAIRLEEAGRALKESPRPDMRNGSHPAPFNPTSLPDDKFRDWYEKGVLDKAR